MPFGAFYTGYRKTVMRPDELLLAIEIPKVTGRQHFRKVGTRAAQAISKVVMAAVFGPSVRIAIGSVAPTVVRRAAHRRPSRFRRLDRRKPGACSPRRSRPIDDLRSTAAVPPPRGGQRPRALLAGSGA